ncbi:M23 family metallopeptidase, partial [Burkholderia sp. SIMBA_013]
VREFGADGARGIEITGHAGTPIRAAAPGRVVYAGDSIKAYGLMVIVKHENGYVTAYGNNRRLLVAEGDPVHQGASIA